jgi:hypothetical protein
MTYTDITTTTTSKGYPSHPGNLEVEHTHQDGDLLGLAWLSCPFSPLFLLTHLFSFHFLFSNGFPASIVVTVSRFCCIVFIETGCFLSKRTDESFNHFLMIFSLFHFTRVVG